MAERAADHVLIKIGESEEFAPYLDYVDEIAASPSIERPELVVDTAQWADEELAKRTHSSRMSSRVAWIMLPIEVLALAGCIIAIIVDAQTLPHTTPLRDPTFFLWFIPIMGIFLTVGLTFSTAAAGFGERKVLRELGDKIEGEAIERLEPELTSRFALAARETLWARGLLQFPRDAPRLVELDATKVVTSRSIGRVRRFIEGHETSALGIAGPRGVGKSTLISAISRFVREDGGLAVVHPAPVEYTATDFLRSIAYALLDEVDHGQWRRLARVRARRRWLLLMMVFLAVGTLALLSALMPSVATAVGGFLLASWPFLSAGVILGAGIFFAIRAIWLPLKSNRTRDLSAPLRRLVEDLEYEASRTDAVGARGVAEVTLSRSRSRRPLTHADLVKELRRALRALGGSGGASRVMLAVDELDKLPGRKAAIRAVNVLKDLLHVPGVHVLVTVSDEARASFGLFGAQRDAFDSTFDAIFEVERLSFEDARDLIDSRAVGFPLPLLVVSHVASAGLPRDLIRLCRDLIDRVGDTQPMPPWVELARAAAIDDAQGNLSALGRLAVDVDELPDAVADLARLAAFPGELISALELPPSRTPTLDRIYARTFIRLAVSEWVVGLSPDEVPDIQTVEMLRDAMLLAERGPAGMAAVRMCRTALGMAPEPAQD